jgi:rod shape determining protein RodA
MIGRPPVLLARLTALGTRFYIACALIVVYLLLVGYGIVFAHSTGEPDIAYPSPDDVRHLVRSIVALVCGFLVLLPHWRHYERSAYVIYVAVLVGLVAVLLVGPSVRATRRWLDLGIMRFQVSEVAKIALVLALARYLKATREKQSVRTSLWALALALVPMLLIIKEPDLGTSLLLPPTLLAVLFCARGRPAHVLIILLAGIALAPLIYEFGLADYQKRRVVGFLSPDAEKLDPDAVLQRERALEAIGTGGLLGAGLGEGDRSLPVRKSDFIFAVIAEETGFVGAGLLIALYATFFYLGCAIAQGAYDLFARLACVGISVSVCIQAATNMAMAVGLLPVTGLTLPLISQGGSSLLAVSIGVGMLVNVAVRPTYTLARKARFLRPS